ncbi:MAG: ChaB family protein [Rhodospirillales bacterium]|nr:ChaB family protein [Rhodospirillales bacterium]
MPYASIRDLPETLQRALPTHAQEIYCAAFNNAWERVDSEAAAHRIAWAAVKRRYRKQDGVWVALPPNAARERSIDDE